MAHPVFKCKIYKKVLGNLKYYTGHVKLHKNISNFSIPCPLPTCPRKYKKEKASSLRGHISRDHCKAVNKQIVDYSRLTNLNCNVPFCQQLCCETSDLISHLQTHIKKTTTLCYVLMMGVVPSIQTDHRFLHICLASTGLRHK